MKRQKIKKQKVNNKNSQNTKKKLFIICSLCGILLMVATYAWFIGMKTVNVETFDVTIASIDGLSLSLNGKDWSDTVKINADNYNDPDTVGNTTTNSWTGLIPMSSVGKINEESSRLTLYEKGSLTASPGGYRLMASEVQNTGSAEANGYVAFDLFIKNMSGNKYYTEYNPLNEEAIYLTPDSEVTISENGGEANTGIENSVRVAFAQIGRVIATTPTEDGSEIRAIKCDSSGGVTSICSRVATIWEPNDTKHVDNAINWYTTSCIARKTNGQDVTSANSFEGTCNTIADGNAYQTYAVGGVIMEDDNVDVYDGPAYNNYEGSISSTPQDGKLYAFPYFTDTMKNLEGTNRPTFMTLAPNSITKVRIYVYIEGQDIDNYDFASLGKKISVAFGFTKERFYGEDIDYDGNPELPDEVVRTRKVSYTNVGTVVPDDSRITFDDEKNEFTIPNWFRAFTFTDNGQAKVATGTDSGDTVNWEFKDK